MPRGTASIRAGEVLVGTTRARDPPVISSTMTAMSNRTTTSHGALAAAIIALAGCVGAPMDEESSSNNLIRGQLALCAGAETVTEAETVRALLVGSTLQGRACPGRSDRFSLSTSASTTTLLRVQIDPLDGAGELDAAVESADGRLKYPSQGAPGVESRTIGVVASSEPQVLRVSLLGDRAAGVPHGRAYMAHLEAVPRSADGCCSSHDGAGCADDAVLACVCQLDNACCRGPYDATCVAEARSSCEPRCEPAAPEGGCCTPSGAGGCSQPDVEACVCAIDPYCCVGGFDEHCVNLASGRCGAACPSLATEAP